MRSGGSPWVKQLMAVANLNDLAKRVTLIPKEKLNPSVLNEFNAADSVRQQLNQCYVPGESSTRALAKILALVMDNASKQFPSTHEFSLRVNSMRFSVPPATVICLTGLAGLGKSALFDALQRLLCSLPDISIPKHGQVEHKPVSRVQILNRWGARAMNRHFSLPGTGGDIARSLYQRGCSLIALDELQFVATSEKANTRTSKLIYDTSLYGPALVFACNFSLVHKLKRRPHEERDRMLNSPIVLLPDLAQSVEWKERISVWSIAIEEILDFDLKERAEDLWSLVAGINRSAIGLLSISSALALKNRSRLRWEHIEGAYKSLEFSAARSDIESIQAIALGGDQGRLDLICPFESADVAAYLNGMKQIRRLRFSESVGAAAQTKDVRQLIKRELAKVEKPTEKKRIAKPLDAATLVKSAVDLRNEIHMGRRK